jgi:hypothetical protein
MRGYVIVFSKEKEPAMGSEAKMILDLVEHTAFKRGESGFARLTNPQGLSIPCRVKHTPFWYHVYFDYQGQSWMGKQSDLGEIPGARPNRPKSRCNCVVIGQKRRNRFHVATAPVPLPVPEDLQQLTYRIYGESVQRLLTELINRGWTIAPPTK